jgi:hypothetical protein
VISVTLAVAGTRRGTLMMKSLAVRDIASGPLDIQVVDGFLARPTAVRRRALTSPFRPDGGGYPGERAPCDLPENEILLPVERLLGRRLDRSSVRLAFSRVTRCGADLTPHQRMPHADGCDVAGVVYLNPPGQCRGGTGFYRHRPSGLSALPAEIGPAVVEVMRRQGLWTPGQLAAWITAPPADGRRGFITGSTAEWELTALVPMRFNRLVLYDGRRFHSGYLEDGWFGDTPAHRRLTLNLFADFAAE